MTQNQVVTLKKHIYGERIFSNLGSKIFNKKTKEFASKTSKTLAARALTKGSEKVGDFAGQWAGDKIVGILKGKNKQNTPVEPIKKVTFSMKDSIIPTEPEIQPIPTNYEPKKSEQLTDF